ncbi:MAG: pantetheine-phosphate adenylyltransferase [Eggerthellales bacterium]|nr:pantetheine-phosphate adenylyltransferase [Eggerthellales bacterium]
MVKAIVPGTFDPITNGHLDVVARASNMFDEVVIAVASSHKKRPLFSLEERIALANQAVSEMKGLKNVSVVGFDDLLISFAHQIGADVVVKGLRAITDFEYEFQMTAANYQMDPSLETMFIMSPPHYMYLSSSIVREIASFGGDVAGIVPPCVDAALKNKLS